METETIFVHKVCNSQLLRLEGGTFYCEVCVRFVSPREINEVDNSPSSFAG